MGNEVLTSLGQSMADDFYQAITKGIRVTVFPRFLDEQSSPEEHYYFWAYTVEILNTSDKTVQLKRRHWNITDGSGTVETVDGDGVVGEQPVLPPGESFVYTSGCPLKTPSGIMKGNYAMSGDEDEEFKIDIPAFSLDSPFEGKSLN